MSPIGPEPVVVVGAGLAGAACARELLSAGITTRVLDRGRRPGGRMSGRALGGREADLGASYLTVSDDDFAQVVDDWRGRRLARPWTDSFTVLAPGEQPADKEGPLRWGGTEGLRSLVEDLLEPVVAAGQLDRHEVRQVARDPEGGLTVDHVPACAVVLAMPDPQAARLLGPGVADVAGSLDREWEPVIALAARWEERTWDRLSSDVFHGAFVNDHPDLAWVADDGRRRGDGAPVLVAHSTPELARQHLDDPSGAEPVLRRALVDVLGVPEPAETLVHRWSFARPTGERSAPYLLQRLGDDRTPDIVAACGDGWGETSKVETAWRSGRDLGRAVVAELS